ncbi:MAG: DNA repair protein RadC, partial [Eubacteriales bacterium]|nr:DNA repair protein RadC [Eubacteriales bacterium]
VKASQILAALELGTRAQSQAHKPRTAIRSPDDAMLLFDGEMRHLPREELRALLLDIRSRVIRTVCLSQGGLSSAVIYPRDLFREAVKANAASLILAHNHPSGDASPSKEDIETTRRLMEAGEMMGIRVVDHLIVAAGGSVSLRQLGYL